MNKAEARKYGRAARKSVEDVGFISKSICEKILADTDFLNAEYVLLYVPYNKEIELDSIFEYCFKNNRFVAVPKIIDSDKSRMEFIRIHSNDELKSGYMGIPEPEGNDYIDVFGEKNVYMVLPGLAFDKSGGRTGYGKGYYDRYIARGIVGIKVGVAMEKALVDYLETDEYDVMYDRLYTESGIYERREEDV